MSVFGSDLTPYVALILIGFLPSEVWRWAGLVIGRGVDETSELLAWVRAVATATLAAVVAKLLFFPGGALALIPLDWRAGALLAGCLAYAAAKRSVLAGVVVGEATIIVAAFRLGL